MKLFRAIGSLLASIALLFGVLVVGGALALIGYFTGAILMGACIVGVIACAIYEYFEEDA